MRQQNDHTLEASLQRLAQLIDHQQQSSEKAANGSLPTILSRITATTKPEGYLPSSSRSSEVSLNKVRDYIDLALKAFQKSSLPLVDDKRRAHFVLTLSETYESIGIYDAALQNYAVALEHATKSKDLGLQGKIEYRMARVHSGMAEWKQAQYLLNKAIITLQSVQDYNETALAQIELAKIAYRKGNYRLAMTTFQVALRTAERVSDTRSKAVINNKLGVIRRMNEEYEQAYQHFQEALIAFQSIQDLEGAAESLNNLGRVHLWRKEPQEAMSYFEKSHQLCQDSGNIGLLPFIYLNKAEFCCHTEDYAMAANMCAKALEDFVYLKNPVGVAKANLLFGRIFWKSGDYATSQGFYEESARLYEKFMVPLGLANCYREYAKVLDASGNSQESAHFNSQAKAIYERLNIQHHPRK